MMDQASTPETAAFPADSSNRPLTILLLAGAGAVVLAGTLALWAYYGTAVFFETVRTGFIACFG